MNGSGNAIGGFVGATSNLGNSGITSLYNDFTNTNVTGNTNVGGFIGLGNIVEIATSASAGSVTGVSNVGGFAGYMQEVNNKPSGINNSYSTASVTASGNDVGGFVGHADQSDGVSNSYSSGLISASGATNVGGFVGEADYKAGMTNDYFDTQTSNVTNAAGLDKTFVAPFSSSQIFITAGCFTGSCAVGSANLSALSTYATSPFGFSGFGIGTTTANTWVILDGQTRPMLSAEYASNNNASYYTQQVVTAHAMQLINLNTTTKAASYTLGYDIDASGTSNAADVWGTSVANARAGFVPIGTASNKFTGNISGGYVVENLYIYKPTGTDVGLFGNVASNATISTIAVTGSITGLNNVGALIGTNAGTVTNTYNRASVTAGNSASNIGGLIGVNTGSVSNSYSAGAVTTGTSPTNVGGFVGNTSGTVTGSYWDTDLSTQSNGYGTGNTAGLFGGCFSGTCAISAGAHSNNAGANTLNMSTQATYSGWDFTNTWLINPGVTYPYFRNSSYFSTGPNAFTVVPVYTGLGAGSVISLLINGSVFGTTYTTNTNGIAVISLTSSQLASTASAVAYISSNSTLGKHYV